MMSGLDRIGDKRYAVAIGAGLAVTSGGALLGELRGSFWLTVVGAPMVGSFVAGLLARRGVRGGIKAGFGVTGLFLSGTVLYLGIRSVYGDALDDAWLFGFVVLFALYAGLLLPAGGGAGAVAGRLVGARPQFEPGPSEGDLPTSGSDVSPDQSRVDPATAAPPRLVRGIGEGYLFGMVVGTVVLTTGPPDLFVVAVLILTLTVPLLAGVLAGHRSRAGDATTGFFCGASAAALLALTAAWYFFPTDSSGGSGVFLAILLVLVVFGLLLGGIGGILGAKSEAAERRESGA